MERSCQRTAQVPKLAFVRSAGAGSAADTLMRNCFCFSSTRRVMGAWWPSRSSKPPSVRFTGRDKFDSYPLRQLDAADFLKAAVVAGGLTKPAHSNVTRFFKTHRG